jgi:hypothetical protein
MRWAPLHKPVRRHSGVPRSSRFTRPGMTAPINVENELIDAQLNLDRPWDVF